MLCEFIDYMYNTVSKLLTGEHIVGITSYSFNLIQFTKISKGGFNEIEVQNQN